MQWGENMEKRVIIAGCRDYTNYDEARGFIEYCIETFQVKGTLVLLSGRCRGADQLGERFAKENGWTIEQYPAEWKKYGRAAGPIRNKKMIDECDVVICFWNGKSKGTGSLIQYAKEAGKLLAVKLVEV